MCKGPNRGCRGYDTPNNVTTCSQQLFDSNKIQIRSGLELLQFFVVFNRVAPPCGYKISITWGRNVSSLINWKNVTFHELATIFCKNGSLVAETRHLAFKVRSYECTPSPLQWIYICTSAHVRKIKIISLNCLLFRTTNFKIMLLVS